MPDDGQADPQDLLKDLFIYAPLGAVLIARDRIGPFVDEAIERGREEFGAARTGIRNQVRIAKSVGRTRVRKRVAELGDRTDEPPLRAARQVGESVLRQAEQAVSDATERLGPLEESFKEVRSAGEEAIRRAQEQVGMRLARNQRGREEDEPGNRGNGGSPRPPSAARSRPARSAATGKGRAPSPDGLAIAEYDSLSAAQINARLGGLTAGELEHVLAYESKTRGRKTVLARVEQEIRRQ